MVHSAGSKSPTPLSGRPGIRRAPLLFEVDWSQDAEHLENKIADYADLCGKVRVVITLDMKYRAPWYSSRSPPPNARLCLYRFTYETDADTGKIIYAMDLASELKLPSSTSTTSGSNQQLGDLMPQYKTLHPSPSLPSPIPLPYMTCLARSEPRPHVFRKAIDDSSAKTSYQSPKIPAAVLGPCAKRRPMRKREREEQDGEPKFTGDEEEQKK
ncbi:hypothetical protein DL767_010278 [Monosporascus sp. MG133]|nr:hypothetical protein DL767_010278 [Monosporascus sp. MG133]